ncbi:MAG: amidophosphoribosyltransferase [Nanoarchaeota archaeon]|nr:amidophosphoribosyltransferase [Nanoarchaeota archaeon]MCG2717591.1 amidophosphoribosyltransferase [Nanoarchaeota archaeon]
MCGIFGIFDHKDAATITYEGLFGLQHRGQESTGIVTSDGNTLYKDKGMGLVSEVYVKTNKEARDRQVALENLIGDTAIGHVRYSTSGDSNLSNAQPITIIHKGKEYSIAHNGNLTNYEKLREDLEDNGSVFKTNSDTEVILHLMIKSKKRNLENKVFDALSQVKGAYSLIIMTKDEMVAAMDPYGFRPLSLGKLDDSYVLASETCAFDQIDAEYIRDIIPGEILKINKDGQKAVFFLPKERKHCIFEYVYFARPNSVVFNEYMHGIREEFGRQLAREHPVDADIVIGVPDSGMYAAWGFSQVSDIMLKFAISRNHYIPRSFIQPSGRKQSVKLKLSPIKKSIKDNKVVLVDDSLVRSNTMKKIVKMMKDCGAKEVHVRISSPPITNPCYYGIDTPTKQELIASSKSVKDIQKAIGADSLEYLSLKGMLNCTRRCTKEFCTACFDGKYPVL